jgi:hypothetical protein
MFIVCKYFNKRLVLLLKAVPIRKNVRNTCIRQYSMQYFILGENEQHDDDLVGNVDDRCEGGHTPVLTISNSVLLSSSQTGIIILEYENEKALI